MKIPEQLFIPGAEPPPDADKNDEVETLMWSWFDARDEQKRHALAAKVKHASLLAKLDELGIDRYPYVDSISGKKRYVVATSKREVRTTNAPKPPREKKPRNSRAKPDASEQVEVRTVPRASVEHEIDPFAKVRAEMEAQ